MKINEYESKWDFKIEGELAQGFYGSIEREDLPEVINYSKQILDTCKKYISENESNKEEFEYTINELEELQNKFESIDIEDGEQIDSCLTDLYDFCDENLILIDVKEENPDAEVYIDSSKDINTKEKEEEPKEEGENEEETIDQVEVVELDDEEESK